MPILRRPQRVERSPTEDDDSSTGSSAAPAWRPRERSGEYRIIAPRRATAKMWAQRPPGSTATLPSMNAVRHARPAAVPEPSRPASTAIAATLPDVPASNQPSHSPPLPSPRELDDFDFLDDPAVALDLGAVPAGHADIETIAGKLPRAVRFTPQPMEAVKAPPSSSQGSPVVHDRPPDRAPDTTLDDLEHPIASRHEPLSLGDVDAVPTAIIGVPAFDPRPGIVAFAGFGIAPEKLSDTPAYALRVFTRRRILRAGLEVARRHRPQDVELYQSALDAADEAAVRRGVVLLVMMVTAAIGAIVAAFGLVM